MTTRADHQAPVAVQGYEPTHPWYYRLGGRILMPREIASFAATLNCEHPRAVLEIFDLPEPQRSTAIRAARERARSTIISDLRRYREHARRVRYRRRWLGPYPDEDRDIWNEPITAVSLKFNHLLHGFTILAALDRVPNEQLALF